MLNLTDPQLTPIVARYRAWVDEQNEEPRRHNTFAAKFNTALYDARDREIMNYKVMSWREKRGKEEPSLHVSGTIWMKELIPLSYQGFLDWCIREGIEAPKGGA